MSAPSPSIDHPAERLNAPWAEPVAAVARVLEADAERGLVEAEAERRLASMGPNTLAVQAADPWWRLLGRQFVTPLILVLFAAAAVSLAVGAVIDALTILAIVGLNGVLGFVQEWRAAQALEALRGLTSPHARVVRDGRGREVEARALVPGDLVTLDAGDRVPTDLRLVQATDLRVDESALTGESAPVSKGVAAVAAEAPLAERSAMVWAGTVVTSGTARGLATATGMGTELGRIARLTGEVEDEQTPLQRKLGVLGRQLGGLALAVAALVALVGWLLGHPLITMFMTGVSLAVAAVPEGLPAVVTVTLALGVRQMVRRNVLLRRLPAAEALGAATVICTDKTGTLTQNEMTVRAAWLASGPVVVTGAGYAPDGHVERDGARLDLDTAPDLLALLETGLRCNHADVYTEDGAWHAAGDPTEAALVVAAMKVSLSTASCPCATEFAFTSERKRMTVVEQTGEGLVAHVKGAPEAILPRCTAVQVGDRAEPMTDAHRAEAVAAYRRFAEAGQRTLALARRTLPDGRALDADAVERDLVLLGIVGIEDPPRPEAEAAVREAERAGIRVVMITGDAPETAHAIGQQVGIGTPSPLTGVDLAAMDDAALADALRGPVVVARAAPEHKIRIVGLLQAQGEIVAMTGDGVNDAPALKKADVGVAMGLRGTDVARDASDIVLTDDNFASIIAGVEEGRRQFANVEKFVRYLLTSNAGEVLAVGLNIALGGPLLLLPVQILWMNLVTDGATALALGAEPVERDAMRRPPRDPSAPILGRRWMGLILLMGAYLAAAALVLFHGVLGAGGPDALARAQTVAFTALVVMQKVNVFNFRSLHLPLTSLGVFSNPWLLLAVAGSLGLQVAAVYVPVLQTALGTVGLDAAAWGWIALAAVPVFVVPEAIKAVLRYRARRSGTA